MALLEAVEVGFGGAGRNVGLVNAGLWVMPDAVPELLGPSYGERLLAELGDAPGLVFDTVERHGIACEATRAGTLHCAVGAAGLAEVEERARQWRARGAPVALLDAARRPAPSAPRPMRARCSTGAPARCSRWPTRAASPTRPCGPARASSPAAPCSPRRTRGRAGGCAPPRAACGAGRVIVATDAYGAGGAGSPWPAVRAEQVHLPYFNLATPPLSSNLAGSILPGREGAWDTREVLSSFRFDAAGRLVFGSVGALRGTGRAVHRAWARRALGRLFPRLAGVDFEHEWHGAIGMTADALPRFHRLGRGVVGFSGYNGRGIAPGTAFGRLLARLAAGRDRRGRPPAAGDGARPGPVPGRPGGLVRGRRAGGPRRVGAGVRRG